MVHPGMTLYSSLFGFAPVVCVFTFNRCGCNGPLTWSDLLFSTVDHETEMSLEKSSRQRGGFVLIKPTRVGNLSCRGLGSNLLNIIKMKLTSLQHI